MSDTAALPCLVQMGLAQRRDGLLTFGECGLYLDVQPGEAVAPGDWVATAAGSRYLVLTARRVERARHQQQDRYQLRCARLTRGCDVPADVVCWELRWYPRQRRRP